MSHLTHSDTLVARRRVAIQVREDGPVDQYRPLKTVHITCRIEVNLDQLLKEYALKAYHSKGKKSDEARGALKIIIEG